MGMPSNETILTLGFLGLAVYFSVLMARGVLGYLRFRKIRPTAVLTWRGPRPPHLRFLLALGAVSAGLAVLNGALDRPLHTVYSQGIMALYFMLMVPLTAAIPVGFYRDGVWADAGFLPYGDIARWAFRETPEIVLVLLPRGRSGSFRLPVPPEEYGAVRKVLQEKIRAHIVEAEAGILGL
ncbi:MAG: hypothetical protein HY317_06120 [Acidobacteria bacterium]|nr:hypothetical protein [Acidobacteriota bacterium]